MGYYSICNYFVMNNFRYGTLRSRMPYPMTSEYRICAIRRRSYYLFHHAILCSFYSRVAANREWRLLNSVVWIKVFCKYKGFEKSQFYKINEEFRCGDLVLKQNFQIRATSCWFKIMCASRGPLDGSSSTSNNILIGGAM